MQRFDFLLVLLGIILGLGITQVLSGFANAIQHRRRARPYWVQLAWMTLLFLLQVEYWYSLQGWKEGPGLGADFFGYCGTLFAALALYITTVVVVPAIPPTGDFDCEADYYDNARWTFALATLALLVLAIHKSVHLGQHWTDPRNVIRGCACLVTVGAAITRDRRYHSAAPFVLVGLLASFAWLYADG